MSALWRLISWTLLALALLCATGCGSSVVKQVVEAPPLIGPPSPPANTTKEDKRVEAADAKVARLTGELAAAKTEASSARKQREEVDLKWLRRLILWLSGACVLGILGFTIAAAFAKSWTLAAAVGAFAVGLVALQVTSFALAHMGLIIGIVVAGGALAFLGWYLHNRTKNRALVDTANYGDSVAAILEGIGAGQQLAKLKAVAAADQLENGTKRMVTGALASLKKIKEKAADGDHRGD